MKRYDPENVVRCSHPTNRKNKKGRYTEYDR